LYTLLDKKQLDEIHLATLNVLERVGVVIYDDESFRLMGEAGCEVDQATRIVKIPKKVIDATVDKTPHSLVLGAREKERDLLIERGRVSSRPGSGYTKVLDIETGQSRNATMKDTTASARLVDALDNISFCATHLIPSDVPVTMADVHAVRTCLENTTKHLFFSPLTYETFRTIVGMAQIVRGGQNEFVKRPLVSFLAATSTPLKIGQDCARQIIACARSKVPVMLDSSPMLGTTGPVTLAGSLVLQNVEDLAMNAIVQLSSPNSPVIYGTRCAPVDMRTGGLSWGSAETALLSAAGVQIAHYYGMPSDAVGPCTDSKTHDEQVGFEKTLCSLFPALAGSEIVSGAGTMESLVGSSLAQLVIDDELYGMMFRALRGMIVDDETLATDLIAQVGHDASYIKYPHTLRYYEKEHYQPRLFDKSPRGRWQSAGHARIEQVAKKKADTILSKHEVPPLDRDIRKQLDNIVRQLDAHL